MKTVTINSHIAYDVIIESGSLKKSGEIIYNKLYSDRKAKDIKVLVLLNNDLQTLAKPLIDSLSNKGFYVCSLLLPVGEDSKNISTLQLIIDTLIDNNFTREDVVVTFGGGSIGDVGGFATSIFKRGIKLVHIPTTLLAMVDSAIGGKTAINYQNTKNVLGTFYQPNLVIEDDGILKTLSKEDWLSGVGEIIKYGILHNDLSKKIQSQITLDNIADIISDCVNIKKRYIEQDEYDENVRHFLNLGHTIGHAIETVSAFTIPHGIAVANGIYLIAKCIDKKYGQNVSAKIKNILDIQGISTAININIDDIISVIDRDKKWEYNKLKLVVFTDFGCPKIESFNKESFVDFITKGLNESRD